MSNVRKDGKCRKGHEMNIFNTYTRPDGKAACKQCASDASKRAYVKKKALGMATSMSYADAYAQRADRRM